MLEKTINNAICALLFRCEQQSVKEMDKIHAMQLFIKVAELESFSRAADFFALPKGSVSRQIQALEHQLGTQLLQRTTRRVKLTPEGMTYYQRAKDVLSNLSELDGLFQQDATVSAVNYASTSRQESRKACYCRACRNFSICIRELSWN